MIGKAQGQIAGLLATYDFKPFAVPMPNMASVLKIFRRTPNHLNYYYSDKRLLFGISTDAVQSQPFDSDFRIVI